jgi:hypothetical protein
MAMDACTLCGWERDDAPPCGEWIHRDRLWSVSVFPGYEVPGWLALQLRRHAEGPAGMNDEEAASLGPMISDLSKAIVETLPGSKVYIVAFGEVYPHFHVLLAPRTIDSPSDLRGPALIAGRAEVVDVPAALDVAARIRERLTAKGRRPPDRTSRGSGTEPSRT